ncbi:conserved hypothetical protein [uncultured Thiomicrorhabdus sp.]
MDSANYSIAQLQWQEQLNGHWLLSLQITADNATDKNAVDFITARFSLNSGQPLNLFAIHSLSDNHWQLQFLCGSQIEIASDTCLQIIWSEKTPPLKADKLLMLGEELCMAPLFALAKQRQNHTNPTGDLVLLHAQKKFPFAIKPARFMVQGTPPEAIGACTLLEDWKIANRLCSEDFIAGCAQMSLAEMLAEWLQTALIIEQHRPKNVVDEWHVILSATKSTIQECCELLNQASLKANSLKINLLCL